MGKGAGALHSVAPVAEVLIRAGVGGTIAYVVGFADRLAVLRRSCRPASDNSGSAPRTAARRGAG
eukprot:10243014-Heterocapsa_arctica.AAC.1